MNLWARFDEEDPDMVHFSAELPKLYIRKGKPIRRSLATVHIDDLGLFFGDSGLELLERLKEEKYVFCWPKLELEDEE